MTNYKLLLIVTLFSAAVACKSEDKEEETTTTNISAPAKPAATNAAAGNTNTTPALENQARVVPPATSTAAALNPPHGQPGHRCDIEVGKPLNSAPSTAALKPPPPPISATKSQPVPQVQPTVSPQIVQQPAQSATPALATGTGKNPPHGQPGHRCDIAVGAPLNSKPAAAAAPSATPAVSANPAPVNAAPAPAGLTKNPAHGQPGHRCDIAVGAPLDSKPAAKQ